MWAIVAYLEFLALLGLAGRVWYLLGVQHDVEMQLARALQRLAQRSTAYEGSQPWHKG